MRVAITGASGFIGRHVARAMVQRGAQVVALGRCDPDIPGVGFLSLDVLAGDPAPVLAEARADTLVHCAWDTTHGAFWTSPANVAWQAATLRLAEAFRAAGGTRLVGLGSCAEYDWTALPADGLVLEDAPCQPATPYGRAKLATFEALRAMPGLSVAWARLFLLYGPEEQPGRLFPSVIAALRRGEPARIASGRPVRDFIATEEAGEAIAALALSPVEGAVNIGSGEPRSILDMVTAIATEFGRPDLLAAGALPDRPDDPPALLPNLTRLRGEVGFAEFSPDRRLGLLRALLAGW